MSKKLTDQILKFNVIFQPEPEGGYTVVVPSLRGCVTYGSTLDEAREMAQDAIAGFVESLKANGEDIPNDDKSFMDTVDLRFSAS